MATWDALNNEVRPLLPDASVLTIQRAARAAARKFCKETNAWRGDVAFTLTGGSRTQDLSSAIPTGAGIYLIAADPTYASDGQKILRTSPTELTGRVHPNWRNEAEDRSGYCYRKSPTEIDFVFTPNDSAVVDLELVYMPLQSSTTIDDDFIEDYWDALVMGTLSIGANMPKEPWYDAVQVQGYAAAFQTAMNEAKALAQHDQTPKATNMAYGGL